MVAWIVIPISIVAGIGLVGYLIYRYVVYDLLCKKSVDKKLQEYHIGKTQSQIIKEYHQLKGETLSQKEISRLGKQYRQKEPEQFLSMYDKIREETKSDK